MTELWEGVKDDLESAINEEKEALAEEGLVQYVQETDDRKGALDELWEDNTVRTEIINHLITQKESLAPIAENLEAALTLDKEALGTYDEVYKSGSAAVSDLTKQIAAAPAAAVKAKPVLDEGKNALEDLKSIKENVEAHIELATYILDKIKVALGG
jgi:chromosome segregation ATPase